MRNDELTNIDIVLYALFRLGGYKHKVHTEEIAYEAYKLAKDRFGWRLTKFRELDFPDKEPVRISLMDAAKEKYGSLVEGRSGVESTGKQVDGWTFTPDGARWMRDQINRIESNLGTDQPRLKNAHGTSIGVMSTPIWLQTRSLPVCKNAYVISLRTLIQ